jgi:hypothetical protein
VNRARRSRLRGGGGTTVKNGEEGGGRAGDGSPRSRGGRTRRKRAQYGVGGRRGREGSRAAERTTAQRGAGRVTGRKVRAKTEFRGVNGAGDGTRQQQVPLTENVPRAVEATARSPLCGWSANGPGKKAQDTTRRFHRHGDARQTAQTHGTAPLDRSESGGGSGEGLPHNTGRANGPRRRMRTPAGRARRRRGPRPRQGRLRG